MNARGEISWTGWMQCFTRKRFETNISWSLCGPAKEFTIHVFFSLTSLKEYLELFCIFWVWQFYFRTPSQHAQSLERKNKYVCIRPFQCSIMSTHSLLKVLSVPSMRCVGTIYHMKLSFSTRNTHKETDTIIS